MTKENLVKRVLELEKKVDLLNLNSGIAVFIGNNDHYWNTKSIPIPTVVHLILKFLNLRIDYKKEIKEAERFELTPISQEPKKKKGAKI